MRSSEEPISAQHAISCPNAKTAASAALARARGGMDELVAAAAAVAMADDGYAVDDVGQRGSQSASAATDVTAPAVGVMDMDQESQQAVLKSRSQNN